MLAADLTAEDLKALLEPHMHRTTWPGLVDDRVRRKAARYAHRYGLWRGLSNRLDAGQPIPCLRYSDYRDYERTDSRVRYEDARRELLLRTDRTAMALWIGHPSGSVDEMEDLLWAWAETSFWVPPAHHFNEVDLMSSDLARRLAEIMTMLGSMLDPRVTERVKAEIERRVINPARDWHTADYWMTSNNNWNHVCCANVIMTALYDIKDPWRLALYILPFIRAMQAGLDGFSDDGGCEEGPGYWQYGFGHFTDAAIALHQRTDGALNIMKGDKIRKIARYPLACVIDGPLRTSFADSSHGYFSARVMLAINRFFRIPELYSLCARQRDGTLRVGNWADFCLLNGRPRLHEPDALDYVLPILGQAKLRAARAPKTVLAAVAGRNDVHHNHNDIGSFIYYSRETEFLTDPGAPVYTATTFTPERQKILHCRSRGHSVPVINGREQVAGRYTDDPKDAYGTLSVDGANEAGPKVCTIDMTHAYDDPTLRSLVRRFTLAPDGRLELSDTYELARQPRAIEEAFITLESAGVREKGRWVRIGKGKNAARLTAVNTPGTFVVHELTEESKQGRSGLVRRIVFTPDTLARRMTLTFRVR